MKVTLDLTPGDLRCLIVAAARYSFRRRTYMPSTIAGIVGRNIDVLDSGTCYVLARDVRGEIAMDERVRDMGKDSYGFEVAECWASMLPMLDKRAKEES